MHKVLCPSVALPICSAAHEHAPLLVHVEYARVNRSGTFITNLADLTGAVRVKQDARSIGAGRMLRLSPKVGCARRACAG